jgi:hypothetical protein
MWAKSLKDKQHHHGSLKCITVLVVSGIMPDTTSSSVWC